MSYRFDPEILCDLLEPEYLGSILAGDLSLELSLEDGLDRLREGGQDVGELLIPGLGVIPFEGYGERGVPPAGESRGSHQMNLQARKMMRAVQQMMSSLIAVDFFILRLSALDQI